VPDPCLCFARPSHAFAHHPFEPLQARNAAQPAVDDSMDPSTFIQTLPAELRQSVLSDMDESMVAVLSEELAAEAQSLRGDAEERHRRFLQVLC